MREGESLPAPLSCPFQLEVEHFRRWIDYSLTRICFTICFCALYEHELLDVIIKFACYQGHARDRRGHGRGPDGPITRSSFNSLSASREARLIALDV